MAQQTIRPNGLALYKTQPALIKHIGDKIEIALPDGKLLKVRPKDIAALHPGPVESFDQLHPPTGDVQPAWELLAGQTTTLPELAELIYGAYTPAAAWAAWQLVEDGLYFHGEVQAIAGRTAEEVAALQATRAARAAEEQAWARFVERVRQGRFEPEDERYLHEVEALALGRSDKSRVLRDLGRPQNPENAHALLLELGYWDATVDPYPQRLDVPLQAPPGPLPPLPAEERLDLTHLAAFAIDDEGAADPDDAVSLEGSRLWVHVADGAALVTPNSAADQEARDRGANLYLPEGTVPMLPVEATRQLGLGLADVSPALSFGIDLSAEGDIQAVEVAPSWVRVTRLTYEEAEGRLDEPPLYELYQLARRRAARRRANGAISLDLPEVKMQVVDGQVHITPLPDLRSRNLVAEAMLAAGEAVARFAIDRQIPLPFTTQDAPDATDEPLPDGMAGSFARRRLIKRSQQSSLPTPHAGLGLDVYVRVTSPLRRYLDLVAHQQLRAYLRGAELLDTQAVLERVGVAEAATSAVAQCERLARQHWTVVYFMQHPGWHGEGILVEAKGTRCTVIIPPLAWEAKVNLRREAPLNSSVALALNGVNLPLLEAYFRAEG